MGLQDRVKELMTDRKVTQQKLAEKAGGSQATISRLLKGTVTNLKRDTLERVGNALGVTAAELLGEEGVAVPKYLFRGYEKLTPEQKALLRKFVSVFAKEKEQKGR